MRERITRGDYAPGDRLPSLDDLAAEFGINRLTARKALVELAGEGLVQAVPAQGTFVAERRQRPTARSARAAMTVAVVSTVMKPARTGPYHMELLDALREELFPLGANLMILPTTRISPESRIAGIIEHASADAVVGIGPFEADTLRRLAARPEPLVVLDHAPGMASVDSVATDSRAGGALAARHVVELGHRRVAIIGGARSQPVTAERMAGMREVLDEAGVRASVVYADYKVAGGYDAMARILRARRRSEAVLCMNDEMAAGALQAIRRHGGIRVPRDLSIVGYDDIAVAAHLAPRLTTVHVPKRDMARIAVQRLRDRLDGTGEARAATTLAPTLVVRESTREARRPR